MRRVFALLALTLLPLTACGTAGGTGGFVSTFLGPFSFALPIFDDGATKSLVLRNLSDQDAPVRITIIPTLSTADVVVPARGELRSPVTLFEGWLIIETRDPLTLALLATSGLVEPFLVTQRTGPDGETSYGAVFHTQKALMPIFPRTAQVSLLNHTAIGVFFDVFYFSANDGVTPPLITSTTVAVGPDDFVPISLAPFASTGGFGQLLVLPPGPGTQFTLGSQQDQDLVYGVDDNLQGDSRLLDQGGTAQAELMLSFGQNTATGQFTDYHILVSNPTDDETANFTINYIRDEFGTPIKTTPRTFNVGPRQTRLFATTLVDSLGMQLGETHPFADHFGDVFLTTGMGNFRMNLSLGNNLIVMARQFDPVTFEYESAVRPTAIRRTVSVLMHDLQTTLANGTENWAWLSNPTNGPLNVQVRAFTAIKGTEYVLPALTIPPNSIFRFRGDALHLKETPGVTIEPDVADLRFLFSSNGPFGTRGLRLQHDPGGIVVLLSPHIVRFEE